MITKLIIIILLAVLVGLHATRHVADNMGNAENLFHLIPWVAIVHRKGLHQALEAFVRVAQRVCSVCAVHVGWGGGLAQGSWDWSG